MGERLGGRKKGTPNKATASAREAIALLVEANVPLMAAWMKKIERKHGPLVAMKCMTDLLEYHIPKLARTELTGKDGAPVATTITHVYEPSEPVTRDE